MTSEAQALAAVLAEAGATAPTGRELAEVLWLARHLPPPEPAASPYVRGHGLQSGDRSVQLVAPGDLPAPATPPAPSPTPPSASPDASPSPTGGAPARAAGLVPLHTPTRSPGPAEGGPPGAGHAPLLVPAPPMLAHPLTVQRSLRPLRRTVPSASRRELDEVETAHHIAALGARPGLWFPVLRPERERWLHLRLVFDAGPTMTMWRPLLRDLHTALSQTGAFRRLDVLRLGTDGRLPPRPWERGRTAVLVVSDCMGPQWREGPAARRWLRSLRGWARELPVAVLQPLPERLWRHTACPPVAGTFRSPGPGVPNSALSFAAYDGGPGGAGPPVPVLEPSGTWLGHWASLVASPGGTEVPGAAAFPREWPASYAKDGSAAGPDSAQDAFDPGTADPEELVLRFRSIASPQAFRLAAHLAVGTAHLPVMRLVQAAIDDQPQPQHLAEVVLSGMLRAEPGPAAGAYDFRPGVREVLLGTLPRTALLSTAGLLARVSAEIESRAGAAPGEFRALARGRGTSGGSASGDPFALVSEESVRLLRGPGAAAEAPSAAEVPADAAPATAVPPPPLSSDRYELGQYIGRGSTGSVWRGHDRYFGRPVAIKFFPYPPLGSASATGWGTGELDRQTVTARFLSQAHELAQLSHPNLVRIFDAFALDEGCCLVSEWVPGDSLRHHLDDRGRLTAAEAVPLARGVLNGLWALHHWRGIAHGNLTPAKVLGISDGLPRLTGFGMHWPYARRDADAARPEDDLYGLGSLLYEMLTGTTPGRNHPPLREVLPDVPPELDSAVRELLSPVPDNRPRGAMALTMLRHESGRPRESVYYQLLGKPRAQIRGVDASQHSFQENAFLCGLLLARGAPVTEEEMREVLRESPHIRPSQYALHLRALGHKIEAEDGAYRLPVPASGLDLARAEELVTLAERAHARGDVAEGVEYYRSALALWYGDPLEGVPGAWAERERQRLREWHAELTGRLAALEQPGTIATGWLLIDTGAADPRTRTNPRSELLRRAAEAVAGVLGGHRPWQSVRSGEPVYRISSPIPPNVSPQAVVEWAVGAFPATLAVVAPPMPSFPPQRFTVVVHDEARLPAAEMLASAGGIQPEVPDRAAALEVTVLISHRVRAGLPRALQRNFARITATAGGWRHVVPVRQADHTDHLPHHVPDGDGDAPPVVDENRGGLLRGLARRLGLGGGGGAGESGPGPGPRDTP
ncbi:SAV_2336 N-terminal domain-related protein [Streptomyces sp. NPDC003036]|uniref:SAV_2336 N-terminal domain-related protein n=1 Tax=Streptomyces sp. NPDC003036 TaxID=3154442 RepID=UPI0033BC5A94